MVDAKFPEYVDEFVDETKRYLDFFGAKLELVTETSENQSRVYRLSDKDEPVQLIVHRTERSLGHPVGEFRSRVHADVRPELTEFFSHGHLDWDDRQR